MPANTLAPFARIALALALAAAACEERAVLLGPDAAVDAPTGGTGGSSGRGGVGGGFPGLAAITVDPAMQTLTIDGVIPATSDYHATGHFVDGHTEDLTARAAFSLVDRSLGTFAASHFTSQTDHGGVTQVFAGAGGFQGSADLTLVLRERATDPRSGGLPADPGPIFNGPPNAGRAPELVYPNDGVLLPPNLEKLEFHFKPGSGNTLFELALQNATTDVKVYMRCATRVGAGCIYLPDSAVWHWLAATNRGKGALGVTLRGTDDSGTGVGTSNALSVSFTQDELNGALYYWTTSHGTAIMRFDFGSRTQTSADLFAGPNLTDGTCIGCHALSRDGRSMTATTESGYDGRILLFDMASGMAKVPFGSPPKSAFESWNGDSTRYVGVYAGNDATTFNPMIFDGTTGMLLGTVDVGGSTTHPIDHPDWSLDGRRIAFARIGSRWPGPPTLARMYEGAIEVTTDAGGGSWSAPRVLVPRTSLVNHYFPTFSPDGSFLVYDQSTCTGSLSKDCNGYQDLTANLMAIALDVPGALPVALAKANAPGRMDGSKTALTNSFPKWSPFVFHRTSEAGATIEWITFSSTRNYGLRAAPASDGDEISTGTLIWMAAVDPGKVVAGAGDPSYPAFALPFQDLTTSNHISQWAEQAVGGPDAGTCGTVGQSCSSSMPCCGGLSCFPDGTCEYVVP